MDSAIPRDATAAADAGASFLAAHELLAGSALAFELAVPAALIDATRVGLAGKVRLRPLTVRDLQLISRAAREQETLTGALMVHASLEEPRLSIAQLHALPVGLLELLLAEVNRISGLAASPDGLESAAEAPLARAAHVLAREFGWSPQQIGELTLGQILLHLQILRTERSGHA